MVRITTRTIGDELGIKLEGRLVGPWVDELAACWRDAVSSGARNVRIDLTAVCHVDTAGRELIEEMHRAGVTFVTGGCLMPELLREIRESVTAAVVRSRR